MTHNADAIESSERRVAPDRQRDLRNSPTRFPSSIYPDPDNVNRAFVTYSGYNAATPTTPGHVFDVREGGPAPGSGSFTNLQVERGTATFPTPTDNGDLPVNDIVRDDAKKKLYVATDFGVVRGNNDGRGDWRVTPDLPRFEITHLEIQPSARVPTCVGLSKKDCSTLIYAATHSQGDLEAGSRRAIAAVLLIWKRAAAGGPLRLGIAVNSGDDETIRLVFLS